MRATQYTIPRFASPCPRNNRLVQAGTTPLEAASHARRRRLLLLEVLVLEAQDPAVLPNGPFHILWNAIRYCTKSPSMLPACHLLPTVSSLCDCILDLRLRKSSPVQTTKSVSEQAKRFHLRIGHVCSNALSAPYT